MRRNVWKDIANGKKNAEQLKKSLHSMHARRPSHQKGQIGNGWRIVKTLLSHRPEMFIFGTNIGGPDILWSVTKWTKACDKRLARWTSHIHHTSDH